MKKLILIAVSVILILALASIMPVIFLYFRLSSAFYTNNQAIEKLKNNAGEHFAFIALGDNHAGMIYDDSATLKLVRNINRENRFKKNPVDFVVNLGDVTFQEGNEWDYVVYNKIRSLIKFPVISLIGNHDDTTSGLNRFQKYLGSKEFSFSDRNSYFIALDNSGSDLSREQFIWLESELVKSLSYKHRFIYMHKSPISPYQRSWYRPELSPWSYKFMKLCEEYKVDMVLSGHEHMFKESSYGGVKYITSGGGGMLTQIPEKDGGYHHYVVVRIFGDYVDYEARKIPPPLWEYLTYYMWKDAFYFLKQLVY